MKRVIFRILPVSLMLTSCLALCLPGAVAADTINVSPGDNLQAVIEDAPDYSTIIFETEEGTYDLTATLNVTKPLTLTSGHNGAIYDDPYNDPKAILDGGGALEIIIYIASDNVTIDGLEVCNGTGDLISQNDTDDPDRQEYSGTTIMNCTIHGSSGDEGVELKICRNCLVKCNKVYNIAEDGVAIADNSSNCEIRNNEIYNSGSENGAIYVYDSTSITIKGNYIHNTTAANGIKIDDNYSGTHVITGNRILHNSWQGGKRNYDEADGNSINIYKPRVASSYNITHNTINDNTGVDGGGNPTGHAIYANDYNGVGFVTNVRDNIIANHNGYGIRTYYGAAVTFSYNDLWQNTLGATDGNPTDGGNNISDNPLLYSDGELQPGSPCIGIASDGGDMGVIFDDCQCGSGGSGNGDENGGGCFIATAAYGSPMESRVDTLRDFRDVYLETNPAGSSFVSLYYRTSPAIAEFIDDHPSLKPAVRAALIPAVGISEVALSTTLAEKIAIAGPLALLSALMVVQLRRRTNWGESFVSKVYRDDQSL